MHDNYDAKWTKTCYERVVETLLLAAKRIKR